jgi:hypothetical protein
MVNPTRSGKAKKEGTTFGGSKQEALNKGSTISIIPLRKSVSPLGSTNESNGLMPFYLV